MAVATSGPGISSSTVTEFLNRISCEGTYMHHDSPTVLRYVLRGFGVLNIVFSLLGAYVAIQTLSSVKFLSNTPDTPIVVQAFYLMTSINLLLLGALAIGGFLLLRSGAHAVEFCNIIFAVEIAYYIMTLLPWWRHGDLSRSLIAASGIGNVGIAPQEVTLYPIVGLVVLNVIRRKIRHCKRLRRPSTHSTAQ